jgi:ribose/xylose/arabinose/galactoside ABC-type transport system permease subunit
MNAIPGGAPPSAPIENILKARTKASFGASAEKMQSIAGRGQAWVVVILLVVFAAYTGYRSQDFWTFRNWQLLVQPLAEAGLVAIGMMVVIASGGIDLSVGSTIGLASVTAALVARHGHGAVAADFAAVLTGSAAGAFNGLLIGSLELPPVLVTLANMVLFSGIAVTLTAGNSITGLPNGVLWWGDAMLLSIPAPFVFFVVVVAIVSLFIHKGLWGRYVISIGCNPIAARFSAMPVAATRWSIYTLQGTLCGLTAVLMMARLASARADMGQSLMLIAIAAVVLGGTPITGGAVSVLGTVAGISTFYIVQNGLTLLGVSPFLQTALVSALLLVAATMGALLRWRPER